MLCHYCACSGTKANANTCLYETALFLFCCLWLQRKHCIWLRPKHTWRCASCVKNRTNASIVYCPHLVIFTGMPNVICRKIETGSIFSVSGIYCIVVWVIYHGIKNTQTLTHTARCDSAFTLPRATVLVAMSSTKSSPSGPGADTLIGFVPSTGCNVHDEYKYGLTIPKTIHLYPCELDIHSD